MHNPPKSIPADMQSSNVEAFEMDQPHQIQGRNGRQPPPIWALPPPPDLISSGENSRASSALSVSASHRRYDDEDEDDEEYDGQRYDNEERSQIETDPSRALRWGRSNFTQDEMLALDEPSQINNNTKDTPIFHTINKPRLNQSLTKCQKVLECFLIIFPALCFTAAAHFINDIMTDFKLFSASFSVFQGVFWPSFILIIVDLIVGRKWMEKQNNNATENIETSFSSSCLGLCCTNGKWKVTFWLLLHSVLSSVAVISQLLSIQRLNISVSLALSFGSTIFVIFFSQINRQKKFSLEMIFCSILAYSGFVTVGIPGMITGRGRLAENLTAGLIASLASSGCAIPATFILNKLRREEKVLDSVLATSFAFFGSLFSLLIKLFVDSKINFDSVFNIDRMSMAWAAGLTTLVIFGTVFSFLEGRFSYIYRDSEGGNQRGFGNSNILRLRLLIFIFSCFWEIIRQGIWNTFPDVYEIVGSILVFSAFLLAVGYEAWSLRQQKMPQDSDKKTNNLFQFIPWLFSREKHTNSK